MKKHLILVLIVFVLSSLACNLTSMTSSDSTPEPTSDPGLIFSDDFSDTGTGWYVGDDLDGSAGYKDGRYEITVKAIESGYWSSPELADQSNVTIEVEAISTGATKDNDFGIVCRAQDADNQYLLLISADGYATIGKLVNGEFSNLASDSWITSDAINQGNALNNIRADCVNDTFALYVNGTEVLTAQDGDFSSGMVGLTVGSYTEPDAAVEFDNFVVRENTTPVEVKAPPVQEEPVSNVLYADDFSDTGSGWDAYISDDGVIVTDYDSGGYRLFVNEAKTFTWSSAYQYFDGDVIIDVDATKIGGPEDNDFGVMCRYQDENNYYLFRISSDGFGQIGKYVNDEFTGISSEKMEPVDGITPGESTNHLRAECLGSDLYLYVNGNLIASGSDTEFTAGDVGLYTGTFDTPGADILFDDFIVTAP